MENQRFSKTAVRFPSVTPQKACVYRQRRPFPIVGAYAHARPRLALQSTLVYIIYKIKKA